MLTTAEQSLAQEGLTGQVKLIQAYAEALSPGLFGETEPFDFVIFSYFALNDSGLETST